MYQRYNDVLEALRHRLSRARNESTTASTGHPYARGTYRSSRDTAAEGLRNEDAGLLGLSVDHQSTNFVIDYYTRR
jgi:hypothetical protein